MQDWTYLRGSKGRVSHSGGLLNDRELRAVEFFKTLEEFNGLPDGEDKLQWRPHRDGVFSFKSAYLSANNSHQQIASWPWRYIWKVKAPTKGLMFLLDGDKRGLFDSREFKKKRLPVLL